MDEKIIIIGAGPAGLSCGYQLKKMNPEEDVTIIEHSNLVGGMSKTITLWGQHVDLGPHRFFTKNNDINTFFDELIQDEFTVVKRQTRIYYNNRYFDYPLKFKNILTNLPLHKTIAILFDYLKTKFQKENNADSNFETWVTHRFGKKLYNTFFIYYSEKLWGIPCNTIDASWAEQRIKKLTLFETIKDALLPKRKSKHASLIDTFKYPKNGTGALYNAAKDYITNRDGNVLLDSKVAHILLDEKSNAVSGVKLINGEVIPATKIVSTMPLTSLVNGLSNVPENVKKAASNLKFRNTILVYLEINQKQLFPDNWLYIHAPEIRHGRITNFRNWCSSLNRDKKTSILCLEFWCFEDDELWHNKEKCIELAKEEIFKINLIPKNAEVLNTYYHRIPNCYPIYNVGYQKNIKIVTNYLDTIEGLFPIGRYGAFKYNNQDHSILMGILAAKKILNKHTVNLWDINSDTEYQEIQQA